MTRLQRYIRSKGIEPKIYYYFWKLLNAKKPEGNLTDDQIFLYELKRLPGFIFFWIDKQRLNLLTYLTKYYPFSLLFQDRLFHNKNSAVRNLMNNMEKTAKDAGIKIELNDGSYFGQLFEFYGEITGRKIKSKEFLEKILQGKYETVYVRGTGNEIRIISNIALLDRFR